ncbi:sialidase-4-like isoform X2 [Hyla sarda]|nr:sialidase-4-like isoform X2 [Hyla sarda]XP_056416259.1 sialidase-4-like isoform X2 [Hyla sarda]
MKGTQPKRTPLFKKESNGCVYRIPSLIYIAGENIFLAFAEKRKSESDVDADSLVMRRGIYKTGYVTWEGLQSLHDICLKDHRMMNPCPVYEDTSKTVFLFFNCIPIAMTEQQMKKWGNSSKLLYSTSGDCGKTWSAPTDITNVTNGIRNMATFYISPGHGIQTQCGKLVVPAYVYVAKFWFIHWWYTKAHAFYVYSEDQGNRWRISERIEKLECGECQLAEVTSEDGQKMLYCNARSPSKKRVEALMLNIGGQFKIAEKSGKLKETEKDGCSGSVLGFPGQEQPGQERRHWLLFSHPTKKVRSHLGLFLNKSPLMFDAWSEPWVIHDGPSAYSDLADCKDANTFAILFESGANSPYEEINFCLFTLEDVMGNINKKKSFIANLFKK